MLISGEAAGPPAAVCAARPTPDAEPPPPLRLPLMPGLHAGCHYVARGAAAAARKRRTRTADAARPQRRRRRWTGRTLFVERPACEGSCGSSLAVGLLLLPPRTPPLQPAARNHRRLPWQPTTSANAGRGRRLSAARSASAIVFTSSAAARQSVSGELLTATVSRAPSATFGRGGVPAAGMAP